MRLPSLRSVREELARRRLAEFLQYLWPVLNPGTELKLSWHIEAICEHLEAVSRGEIKRLIINIPPRHLKSTLCSQMWPAWEWLSNPSAQFLTASNDITLSTRDARMSRSVILSPEYQSMLSDASGQPAWQMKGDQNVKTWYENTAGGHRNCVSTAAKVTGKGGTRGIIDDPHDAYQVESKVQREAVTEWYDTSFSSRMNDANKDPIVVIMQRLHQKDLCGHLMGKGGWEHLCLTTLFESDHPHPSVTSLGFKDPREEDGEMLAAGHFGPEAIAEAQRNLKAYGFAGQHQQRPAPKRGGVFDREDFRRYRSPPTDFDLYVASWDCAVKGKAQESEVVQKRSYQHGSLWGFKGSNVYLLEERRGQWFIGRVIEEMLQQKSDWPVISKILLEDKANGPAIMQLINDKVPGIHAIEPKGSKVQRALAVNPFVTAGNVWVPDEQIAPWVTEWLNEVTGFPNWENDDRVDTFTQVLIDAWIDEKNAAIRRFMTMSEM